MAARLVPYALLTVATLSGFKYTTHYQHPSQHDKPYILFVHGFPSSAYDWQNQVTKFSRQGYGIIAPDTLGYGSTDQPLDVHAYRIQSIANSIMEVVDAVAGPSAKVHGVSHDFGTPTLSRMANFNSSRFLSYSFLAGGYVPPVFYDVDAINNLTESILGYPTLGYWKFFNQSDAGPIVDQHKTSFAELLYPQNMSVWKSHLAPIGSAEAWLKANTQAPHAPYLSNSEFSTHNSIFAPHGYTPALNYYKATMQGLNNADNALVPVNTTTTQPVLFIGGTEDPLQILSSQNAATLAFAPGATVTNVTAGHWMQLEVPEQTAKLLGEVFMKGEECEKKRGKGGKGGW